MDLSIFSESFRILLKLRLVGEITQQNSLIFCILPPVHIKFTKISDLLERLFPSLTAKIIVAMCVVFLIAASLFAFFASLTGNRMLEKGAQAQAHGVAEFGKAILEHIMLQGENEQLRSALERIVTSNHATDVMILNENGEIVLRASSEENVEKLPIDRFVELPEYPGEKFLSLNQDDKIYEYIITPIDKRADCYTCHAGPDSTKGFFGVKISMSDVRSVAMGHRTANIIMTVIIFVGLGGALFAILMVVVLRPVKKLQTRITDIDLQIDRYERGEKVQFTELAVTERKDELTMVLRAFNRLMHRLNEANEKNHELHKLQMEHADRLATTGEMAAGIAHEIKNPVAGVLGALQVFEGEAGHSDERRNIISEMKIQLERVNYAVNDLLSYARPVNPEFKEFDVADVIKRTVSLLAPHAKEPKAKLEMVLPEGKLVLNADKKQVQQILWNIILNGLQALNKEGAVSVSAGEKENSVEIIVKDNGRGIPPEHLNCVFQPFFTTKHKGTGLGMTITKRIIEQHGGTISIQSEPGKGTAVSISLPQKRN